MLYEGTLLRHLSLEAISAVGQRGGRHHHQSGVGVVFAINYLSWAELYIKHIYMQRCAWV
jgi:hypothetical protein